MKVNDLFCIIVVFIVTFVQSNAYVLICIHICTHEWKNTGHTMKNPNTKLSKAMHDLRSHHRLLLTGTAVQNRLKELWVLLDWATRGKVLGRLKEFEQR